MGFRADLRAAALALLDGYAAANGGALRQTYAARPQSIYPPTGFIEAIDDPSIVYSSGPRQRNSEVQLILIQGLFDSAEAAAGQDALVDGFLDYVTANKHAAGGSTLLTLTRVSDLPNYQPDWIVDAPFYYASRVTLEGLIQEGGLI